MPPRELAAIDGQIKNLWACYRKWHALGDAAVAPQDALAEIDVLLEQRHDMVTSQGELRDQRDVAHAEEWGEANLG
jgi:hypothetical protein